MYAIRSYYADFRELADPVGLLAQDRLGLCIQNRRIEGEVHRVRNIGREFAGERDREIALPGHHQRVVHRGIAEAAGLVIRTDFGVGAATGQCQCCRKIV